MQQMPQENPLSNEDEVIESTDTDNDEEEVSEEDIRENEDDYWEGYMDGN